MTLKKEVFWTWLTQGPPEAADRYQKARRAAASVVAGAKTQVWEEFGQIIRPLRRGKQGLAQAVFTRRTADPDWGYC